MAQFREHSRFSACGFYKYLPTHIIMKYNVAIFFLVIFLNACASDSTQTAEKAEDMGAPPSTSRDVAVPGQVDSILPVETTVDSANVVEEMPLPMKPNSSSGAPALPNYKPRVSAPATASPPVGLRGSQTGQDFVDLQQLDASIAFDIRYATENNFTESKIYDCPRCFLRPETAQALIRAQSLLRRQGLSLKLYDCYRPRPYQQRLWDKVPDANYVTPPEKGSMHSRGAAVDLTIVDAEGQELDMGTPYDFFGPEAHYGYSRLSGKVLSNRRLLRRVMEEVGLKGIRTEWWHFSFSGKSYPLSDWVWNCGN